MRTKLLESLLPSREQLQKRAESELVNYFLNPRENQMTTGVCVRPIADRIIVKREETSKETPGGIVLPNAAQDRSTRGKVIAVGSGRLLDDGTRAEMEVSEGDTVVFGGYDGTEVEIDGETVVVLRESDVLMVI